MNKRDRKILRKFFSQLNWLKELFYNHCSELHNFEIRYGNYQLKDKLLHDYKRLLIENYMMKEEIELFKYMIFTMYGVLPK